MWKNLSALEISLIVEEDPNSWPKTLHCSVFFGPEICNWEHISLLQVLDSSKWPSDLKVLDMENCELNINYSAAVLVINLLTSLFANP